MAIDFVSGALRLKIPKTQKFVLIALADHADKNGVCWPSIQTLIELSSCSKNSVLGAIQALEKAGILKVLRRSQHGNKYQINIAVAQQCVEIEPPKEEFTENGGSVAEPQWFSDCTTVVQFENSGGSVLDLGGSVAAPRWFSGCTSVVQPLHLKRQEPSRSVSEASGEIAEAPDPSFTPESTTRFGHLCRLLKVYGIRFSPTGFDADVIRRWETQAVSDSELVSAIESAKASREASNSTQPVGAKYIDGIVRGHREDAKRKAEKSAGGTEIVVPRLHAGSVMTFAWHDGQKREATVQEYDDERERRGMKRKWPDLTAPQAKAVAQ